MSEGGQRWWSVGGWPETYGGIIAVSEAGILRVKRTSYIYTGYNNSRRDLLGGRFLDEGGTAIESYSFSKYRSEFNTGRN